MKVTRKGFRKGRLLLVVALLLVVNAVGFGVFWWTVHSKTQAEWQRVSQIEDEVNTRIAQIEAKKKEPVFITLPGASPFQAIVENYDATDSIWVLVNKKQAISTDYVPANLVVPNVPTRTDVSVNEQSVRQIITGPLEEMFAAAKQAGHNLMIGSAYRPADLQQFYFNSYSAAWGVATAEQYSAHPGHSEHQLGLSVDISTLSRECYLSECFITTPDGQWLAKNAYKYGFTLRYNKGKEAITGYQHEPWHYRYVGVDLATALFESNLALEEAWPYMQEALATLKENRAIEP